MPAMLNGENHFAYIVGYADGTVRPEAGITRAEVAAIFFRLLKPEVRDANLTRQSSFADVPEDAWYASAVATMTKLGILQGRTADSFQPDALITRAEFAAICARFDTGSAAGTSTLCDIAGHWAEQEILRAAARGWVQGYGDGTFRPNQSIRRAKAMTMINRVLLRLPETDEDLLDGMRVWPDNQPGAWHYLAVQEATNSHDFVRKNTKNETWKALTADPDWTRYQ